MTAARKPPKSRKNGKPIADPHADEVEAAIGQMDPAHLHCRDWGHSWRPVSARLLPADNCYESRLVCDRCGTHRLRYLSMRGAQLDSRYDYAEGYTVKGLGRLTGTDRDIVRLKSLMGLIERKEESA